MRWFVQLMRGDSAGAAKPVIAISDEHLVRDVLRSVGKHLGLTPTSLRPVTGRPTTGKPDPGGDE
jgi:hypothetical protein